MGEEIQNQSPEPDVSPTDGSNSQQTPKPVEEELKSAEQQTEPPVLEQDGPAQEVPAPSSSVPPVEPVQTFQSETQSEVSTLAIGPAEPLEPEVQEQVVDKVIEKSAEPRTVTEQSEGSGSGAPRELNEEEQQTLYRTRLKNLSIKGNLSRSNRRLANHAKIIEYLKQHGFITNKEVQKLCNIKDSTATKYLKELQALGRVISIGRKKGVRWRLVQGI